MFADNFTVAGALTGTMMAQGGISATALPTPTGLVATVGSGSANLAQGTYYYRVSAFNALGETLACAEISFFAPNPVAINAIQLTWVPVMGATGYKVYGRATGAQQLLVTLTGGMKSGYTDLDSNIVPSGALPTLNTTGKAKLDEGLPLPTGGAGDLVGTATLVGGTVTVNTTKIAAGSKIFVTRNTIGGTVGDLSAPVASIVAGTSFVINSASGTDTSTVNWMIVN